MRGSSGELGEPAGAEPGGVEQDQPEEKFVGLTFDVTHKSSRTLAPPVTFTGISAANLIALRCASVLFGIPHTSLAIDIKEVCLFCVPMEKGVSYILLSNIDVLTITNMAVSINDVTLEEDEKMAF